MTRDPQPSVEPRGPKPMRGFLLLAAGVLVYVFVKRRRARAHSKRATHEGNGHKAELPFPLDKAVHAGV